MDDFEICSEVNSLLESNQELKAREILIKLLDQLHRDGRDYSSLVNHMIRRSGLYPYLKTESANWDDRCAYEAFKVDVGSKQVVTLHREQSSILRKLINNESIAVSAPTSFGKSFIIDAFISIKQPNNVAIIVPTLALTDETRRRIHKKFSKTHKIITTGDVELADRNIFIFPQERAIQYAKLLPSLDLLVIDEFYKASPDFDKDRSPALQKAMIRLGAIAKQRYFLAPNISDLKDSLFTKGMEFVSVDFNTVFLEKHDLFQEMGGNHQRKAEFLLNLLNTASGKTLIYAATYKNIATVASEIISNKADTRHDRAQEFSKWLEINYTSDWSLTRLSKKGVGIHNGQLHRSISQIQMRLFDDPFGLDSLISTSSIIEGVNTSAENVVIWSNKSGAGNANLKDFSYRNIIGRGGRMLQHFIGKIYILEKPPTPSETQLELSLPSGVLGNIDEVKFANDLTREQIVKIIAFKDEMRELLGEEGITGILDSDEIQNSDSDLIKKIAGGIKSNPNEWNGLNYLNSDNPDDWDRILKKAFFLKIGIFGHGQRADAVVHFLKSLTFNWKLSIPEILSGLGNYDIGIDDFFTMERAATYKYASILSDVAFINRKMTGSNSDISSFTSRLACAFLPPNVFKLEEYGLPRMLSRKIHDAEIINLEDTDTTLHACIENFASIGIEQLICKVKGLTSFEKYILSGFYDGIQETRQEDNLS